MDKNGESGRRIIDRRSAIEHHFPVRLENGWVGSKRDLYVEGSTFVRG
ncbi:hypothetical protein [Haladaptatus caseinilyticus]|nr:hypothetical protein [Haladaptatus caseinilyticus]